MKNTYHVSGMSCKGCKSHVEEVIGSLPHIQGVTVDLEKETAVVTMDHELELEVLQEALKGSLYQIHPESHPRKSKKLSPLPVIGGTKNEGTFYCPMQCEGEKTYSRPGDCPVCGMDLVPLIKTSKEVGRDKTYERLLRKFKVAVLFTLPIFLIAMSEMLPQNPIYDWVSVFYWNWIQLILSIPVVFYATWMFFQRAYSSIVSGNYNMFTLIGIGAGIAWLFSVFGLLFSGALPEQFKSESGTVHLYFESATVILTLVLLGQLLEARAHNRTNGAIQTLLQLSPNRAFKIVGNDEIEFDVDQIELADILRVKPGGKIPVDGEIQNGFGVIDESMITGEPIPSTKQPGDKVRAGTINGQSSFTMVAQEVGTDTLLAQIIEMVNAASRSRAPIQKLADKISAYFVPAVVIIALLTFLVWVVFGPEPRWVYALINSIAVLIIACPCALGLATPMSVMVGVGKGAGLGVLIKDAASLEEMSRVNTLIIDKTGTVTEGRPSVEQVIGWGMDEQKLIQYVGSINQLSEHPLGAATVGYMLEQGFDPLSSTDFQSFAGKGVSANIDQLSVSVGNQKLMADLGVLIDEEKNQIIKEFQAQGKTVSYIACNGKLVGIVVFMDKLKSTSQEAIKRLQDEGIEVIMMTGDNSRTAQAVAEELQLKQVIADCLPEDKMKKVQDLKEEGRSVAMAGDGINDAPALALADVGIAMGAGTDVAIESAAITLVKGDLKGIVKARVLSQKVVRNIRQNLFFALIYNGLGVPVAAGLMFPFFGILLSPMIAALAMSFSSVSVITNALKLRSVSIN